VRLNFEVNNEGKYFTVLIFDDYVIKFPKSNTCKDKDLDRIAKLQTELSRQVDGILPCTKIDNVLVMPKSPGKRTDEYRDTKKKDYIRKLTDRKKKEIESLGYKIADLSWKNCFYVEESDQLYIIDLHRIQKKG